MADRILLKRSSTASAVPTAAQIEPGELATNTADGKVYARKGAAVVEVTDWPSADVVPQPEAETGTATTARKWTALRVRQAIAAWWNSVTSAFGRSFVAAADAAAGRTALELGTAATANVTTSATDTTADRLLKVGDFGLGETPASPTSAIPLPTVLTHYPTGIYTAFGVDVGSPFNPTIGMPANSGAQGYKVIWMRYSTSFSLVFLQSASKAYLGTLNVSTMTWREIYTENLIYAQYSGAGSVAPHATTAGSNLTPAQTGTWRNVSNTVVNNDAHTLWIRV